LFAADDEDVGASNRQDVPAFDSTEVVAEEDKFLLEYLEHVIFCRGLTFELGDYCLGL
jgi:hypothetical protein